MLSLMPMSTRWLILNVGHSKTYRRNTLDTFPRIRKATWQSHVIYVRIIAFYARVNLLKIKHTKRFIYFRCMFSPCMLVYTQLNIPLKGIRNINLPTDHDSIYSTDYFFVVGVYICACPPVRPYVRPTVGGLTFVSRATLHSSQREVKPILWIGICASLFMEEKAFPIYRVIAYD